MPEQKSFWKKYEFLIIVAITLIFIYIVVVSNQKINFFLGNELIVFLESEQKSFSMHYGETNKAQFDVSTDNVAYCKTACLYSFNDRSRSEVIDKGNFEIEKSLHFTTNYNISVKRLGSGQDIYSFDVTCHNVQSFFCLTKSIDITRSSLITVNYDLTETEKKLKEILKQNVTELLEFLNEIDILHQQINQKYFDLGFKVNLLNLSKQKINIDDDFDKTRISIGNLRSLWSVENYIKLNQMFNESFSETLYRIKASVEKLNKSIDDIVELHNELLSGLNKLAEHLNQLESFVYTLEKNETLNELDSNIKNFNKLASSLTNNTFDSYDRLVF